MNMPGLESVRRPLRLRAENIGEDAVPAMCYASCNNAYIDAKSVGKTPALCVADNSFTYYYNGCQACVKTETDAQQYNATEETLNQLFSQYIDYCSVSISSSTDTIPTSWFTLSSTFPTTTITELATDGATVTTALVYKSVITSILPAYFFHVNASSLISAFIPLDVFSQLAASVASAASAASVTGTEDPTSLVYSALEDTSLPPWFEAAVPVTYSTQMATLEAQINELRAEMLASTTSSSPSGSTSSVINGTSSHSSSSSSRAWIAGVVIGPVAAIFLILLGMFCLRRRRSAKKRSSDNSENNTGEKPQLHSDCLPAPQIFEMDGIHNSIELAVSEVPQELPAEVPVERPK
ncbi:hypothetical protein VM1G_07457 [Cytospora mali]|uniref:Uncharacterized protein n=1 Tax=Cytospora mali TaxID=578113 RepID=A0A194W7Z8_CYTMA|nr:hypothetical protein VM1G_07457 [Valsa mali]